MINFKMNILIMILFLPVFIFSQADNDSPDMTMKRLIDLFKSYNRKTEGKELTPSQISENEDIKKKIEKIFHFESLIKGALIDHWDKMTSKQKNEFYSKFKELIEMIAYPQGSYFYNNSKNNFQKSEIKDGRAYIKSENYNYDKDLEISITYIFKKIEDSWVLVDLSMNDHSIIEAYRLQINRIVNKEGLDGLLKTLNKKYDEIKKNQ